jgi:hypothetical protein
MFWALANDQSLIESKVSMFVALAPIVQMKYVGEKLKIASKIIDVAEPIASAIGLYELENPTEYPSGLSTFMSEAESFINEFKTQVKSGSTVSDPPSEFSTREIWHYGQIINAGGRF